MGIRRNVTDVSGIKPLDGTKVVPLTSGKYAIVDEDDYERVIQHNWYYTQNGNVGYAKGDILHSTDRQYLHRFIMNERDPNKRIDHRDGDGLNCKKVNLRHATHKQNLQNTPKIKGCTSKYKGVSWHKKSKKWMVRVAGCGKYGYLGLFTDEVEAAKVYDKKAKELFGEFAYLNFKD